MPKDFRKRGKRAKKSAREKDEDSYVVYARPEETEQHRKALGIDDEDVAELEEDSHPAPATAAQYEDGTQQTTAAGKTAEGQHAPEQGGFGVQQINQEPESIWPAVDPDTKAYFRQLEDRIIELEELNARGKAKVLLQDDENEDEEEDDRVLLLRAALVQLSGKETAIAADPETSVILERLIYSMDDFARRVLADRFAEQYVLLTQDRFASHVIQTLLVLGGGETVERERRGNIATGPSFGGSVSVSDAGELPTMTETIIGITKELLQDIPTLVASQHGSYILRTLMTVLSGKPLPFNSQTSTTRNGAVGRSKKSAKWKANRAGPMRSFMPTQTTDHHDIKGKGPEERIVPLPFTELLDQLIEAIDRTLCGKYGKHSKLGAGQCRSKSDDPVATGLVQIILEIEADKGKSAEPDSMMDRLLEGLVSELAENPNLQQPPRSDYIEALLRSSVSSHVLEVIMTRCPQPVFDLLFKMYFQGRIAKLAGHPVANFVVAKVVERANQEQTEVTIEEIPEALSGMIENSRTGVIQVLLEKALRYNTKHAELHHALCDAFQTRKEEDIQHLLPCGLSLMTLALYRRNAAFSDPTVKPEFFVQGALLLQAWLRLPKCPVAESILQTPIDRLLTYTSDPTASRVIDVFLDEATNPAVAYKDRRNFLKNLIGHYQQLADDRIGSRVADRCWATADPFLKDKIAASLKPHEYALQNSHFGHYFLRKVNLPLYKRDPREWRDRQSRGVGGTPAELYAKAQREQQERQQAHQAVSTAQVPQTASTETAEPGQKEKKDKKEKKKRKKEEQMDEIDELFSKAAPKKSKVVV